MCVNLLGACIPRYLELSCLFVMLDELKTWLINEPSRDKNCIQDIPPGPNLNRAVRPQNMTISLKEFVLLRRAISLKVNYEKVKFSNSVVCDNFSDYKLTYM